MGFSISKFVEGWRNHLIPPEELKEVIEQVSQERLEICKGCPFQSENMKAAGHNILRTDVHCTKCGCPLAAKTKSLSSSCPLSPPLWSAVTTDAERYEIEQQIKKDETDELQTGNA